MVEKHKVEILTAQQRAEKKRSEKRKGAAVFAPIRFTETETESAESKKKRLEKIIAAHGGTRESALLSAFECLDEKMERLNENNRA